MIFKIADFQNNLCDSTLESRPLRGVKNWKKGCSSATADFLLEADKLGSPPKSEKWQLLGTQFNNSWGEWSGGVALLRKEKSESKINFNDSVAKISQTADRFHNE